MYMCVRAWQCVCACVCVRASTRLRACERIVVFLTTLPFGFVIDVDFVFQDPVGQIAKLDQFLGYNRSQELYEQIADACSFPKLKSAKNEMPEEMKKRYFKDDHVGFYRKGETRGDHSCSCTAVRGGYRSKDKGSNNKGDTE